jgi:hypothetical protein
MRRTGGSAQPWSENWDKRGGEWAPFDDVDWPDSSLDVDDAEFARAIAEGRQQERDAA